MTLADPSLEQPRSTLAEGGSAVGGLILGVGLAVLLLSNRDPHDAFNETTRDYTLAAIVCLPGMLCLLAGRSRPALYLAGSMIGGMLPLFLGLLGFVFWIPGGMALVAYERAAGSARGKVADPVVAMVCFALAFASFVGMFLKQDAVCVYGRNSSQCTTDYVTRAEGLIGLAIAVSTPIFGCVLSKPRGDA